MSRPPLARDVGGMAMWREIGADGDRTAFYPRRSDPAEDRTLFRPAIGGIVSIPR